MKIHGPNQINFNSYKDQLQISQKAKKLQENTKPNAERATYVQDIKKEVKSGEYQVSPEKTAQKMIAFWTKPI